MTSDPRHERQLTPSGFYSLHRETYSVTTAPRLSRRPRLQSSFYSLHRETYSVTAHDAIASLALASFYSLHRETYSVTVRRTWAGHSRGRHVSIRCIARRTA